MEMIVQNLGFAYDQKPVLQDINLRLKPGCFYSILGPNGCGKTTLLDLLIRHHRADTGTIMLEKKSIHDFTQKQLARAIALVCQGYDINFPFTVKEIVMMGRHPHIARFARPGSEDVQIVDRIMERTGIKGLMNRRINRLSGGERQRCVVARALCQATPLLFLDEAFSSMDINHTLRLLNIVKTEVLKSNRTVVSVFHDINLAAAWSDSLVFMKQGRIIAAGQTDDVLDEEMVRQVFEVESRVEFNPYSRARQASFKAGYLE